MSTIKVNTLTTLNGSGNITVSRPFTGLSGSGASLTALNATELGSGTVPTARLGSGTANTTVFLRGDNTWATAGSTSASDLTSGTLPIARIADDAITNAKMADDAIGVAQLSATGTASNSVFLRGDNTWTAVDTTNASNLSTGTLPIARIADDAITLAKMAGGTDGQIITYDASGNPVAVGPGTDGQVLTSTGAGSPPAFEAGGVTQTQGTFTPTITGSGGGSGQSYSANEGKYTRVGDIVQCTVRLYLTNKGTITTRLEVHGLPFTNRAGSYNPVSFDQDQYWSLTVTSGYSHKFRGALLQNDTKIGFKQIQNVNDNYDEVTTTHVTNNSGFMLSFTYQIAA